MRMLLSLLLAAPAAAQDKPPNEKLCSIKTVFIIGTGGTAKWFRDNIEKKTWLTIQNVKGDADAILEIDGSGRGFGTVNATLSRRDPEEFLWQDSAGVGFTAPAPALMGKLNKAANCPKPATP